MKLITTKRYLVEAEKYLTNAFYLCEPGDKRNAILKAIVETENAMHLNDAEKE